MSRQERTRKEPEQPPPQRWRSMGTLRRIGDFIVAYQLALFIWEAWEDGTGRHHFAALSAMTRALGRVEFPTNERDLLRKPPMLGGLPLFSWTRP